MTPPKPHGRTQKGKRTKQRIFDAALKLFQERGYEETTMRAIAEEADVAVSNAYYYYASKEHLVQAFYLMTIDLHSEAVEAVLDEETDLQRRLARVLRAKIAAVAPYHSFAGALFRTAGDPASPLNPFSEESGPAREKAMAIYEAIVAGAKTRIHKDVRAELPELLWVFHLGIVLFWVHDKSPGFERTYRLIDQSTELVTRLIKMASLPLMGPIRKLALDMVRDALPGLVGGS